jgi:hypothetical protein
MKSLKNKYFKISLRYGNGFTSLYSLAFHPISRRYAVSFIIILFLGFIIK